MLGQCQRRWARIDTTLGQGLAFAGTEKLLRAEQAVSISMLVPLRHDEQLIECEIKHYYLQKLNLSPAMCITSCALITDGCCCHIDNRS